MKLDVLVVGAGPAGCACAIRLARKGYDVLVMERPVGKRLKIGESLPPAANRLLRELNVWNAFLADGHLPSYGTESAWGSTALHCTEFIRNPDGNGWHLDRGKFDAMLQAQVNVRFTDDPGAWTRINASWVVDATGRQSHVARSRGVRPRVFDRLIAFAALFAPCTHEHQSVTLIESGQFGWWYTAPLPAGFHIAVYLTEARSRTCAEAADRNGFLNLLTSTAHIATRLGAMSSAPEVFAASTSHLEQFAGPGWLAIGDAAMTFDPLSSQGIFHALASGIQAADALAQALQGDTQAIDRYGQTMGSVFRRYLDHRDGFYRRQVLTISEFVGPRLLPVSI